VLLVSCPPAARPPIHKLSLTAKRHANRHTELEKRHAKRHFCVTKMHGGRNRAYTDGLSMIAWFCLAVSSANWSESTWPSVTLTHSLIRIGSTSANRPLAG